MGLVTSRAKVPAAEEMHPSGAPDGTGSTSPASRSESSTPQEECEPRADHSAPHRPPRGSRAHDAKASRAAPGVIQGRPIKEIAGPQLALGVIEIALASCARDPLTPRGARPPNPERLARRRPSVDRSARDPRRPLGRGRGTAGRSLTRPLRAARSAGPTRSARGLAQAAPSWHRDGGTIAHPSPPGRPLGRVDPERPGPRAGRSVVAPRRRDDRSPVRAARLGTGADAPSFHPSPPGRRLEDRLMARRAPPIQEPDAPLPETLPRRSRRRLRPAHLPSLGEATRPPRRPLPVPSHRRARGRGRRPGPCRSDHGGRGARCRVRFPRRAPPLHVRGPGGPDHPRRRGLARRPPPRWRRRPRSRSPSTIASPRKTCIGSPAASNASATGPFPRCGSSRVGRASPPPCSPRASAASADPFKVDVRKLKRLGLTQSFEVGYELSPRGRALLERLPRRRTPGAARRGQSARRKVASARRTRSRR